jgi:hypothetical protein
VASAAEDGQSSEASFSAHRRRYPGSHPRRLSSSTRDALSSSQRLRALAEPINPGVTSEQPRRTRDSLHVAQIFHVSACFEHRTLRYEDAASHADQAARLSLWHTKTAECGLTEFHSRNRQPSHTWRHLCAERYGHHSQTDVPRATAAHTASGPETCRASSHNSRTDRSSHETPHLCRRLLPGHDLDVCTYPSLAVCRPRPVLVLVLILVLPGSGRYRPSS